MFKDLVMRTIYHFLVGFFYVLGIYQTMGQSSVHSSWGEGTGTGGRMTYSMGQVFIQNVTLPGIVRIAEGVQHPLEVLTIGMDDVSQILEGVMLFPNPTVGELTLQIQGFRSGLFSYRVFNNLGQSIQMEDVHNSLTLISLETMAGGTYRIEVNSKLGKQRIFQVIKRN
jgi:hypothetical protein